MRKGQWVGTFYTLELFCSVICLNSFNYFILIFARILHGVFEMYRIRKGVDEWKCT